MANENAPSTYGANDLSYLSGLDAVKKRPGMYIGSTDSAGVQHLVFEILDNSVDEGLAGHASHIDVTFQKDGSVQVDDNGRGIPTDVNQKTGLSGMELALTKLHAGGKFGGSGYKSAGGLHGVGSSVVNALSSRMDATVYRDGKRHDVSFRGGVTGIFDGDGPDAKFTPKSGLRISADKRPAAEKKNRPSGTSIRWWHDKNIFLPGSTVNVDGIRDRARTTAFLVPQLSVTVNDNTLEEPLSETYEFEGGIADMAEYLSTDPKVATPVYIETTGEFEETVPVLQEDGTMASQPVTREVDIKIAFRWGTGYESTVKSYVNVVNTPEGGTHVKGFERGLLKSVQGALKSKRGFVKASDPAIILDDALEGMTAVVSVGFPEPQFEGQTKGKLGTNAIAKLVQTAVSENLTEWFDNRKNTAATKTVLEKIVGAMRVRVAQREQKQLARKKSALETSQSMPEKLVSCNTTDPNIAELQLCEGISALGGLRNSRSSEFQAIYPLRGKPLNTFGMPLSKILENQEISDMVQIIGAGIGKSFDLEQMRYKRIILLADGDADGGHIAVLLCSFFWKFMRPLVEDGRLYVAMPPLFSITTTGKNKERFYALNDEELEKLQKKLKKSNKKYDRIQRHKGLGEYSAEILSEVVMDPATRVLKQVTTEDVESINQVMELALGNKADPRKEWIIENRSLISDEEIDA